MLAAFSVLGGLWADMMRNPPCKLDEGQNSASTCEKCPVDGAENGCVHIQIDLGRTSVLSDRRRCWLKVFETEASPAIFTPETLNFVMDYTFSYVGGDRTNKNVPREVVFCNELGARLHFRFEDGESLATMAAASTAISTERLQMVDAEGWATAEDPAYYDLYPGDGTKWRFYATDITGKFGDLVSFTDARGRVVTAEDFGIDVVRSPNGLLRQILTATRLADIVMVDDHTYTVTVYPFAQKPEMAEGLYVIPEVTPVESWRIERGGDDAHLLLATQRKGNGDPKTYTYRYVPDVEDWTLTRPNGLVEEKSFYSGDDDDGMQVAVKKSADGQTIYSQKAFYFKDYGWSVGAVAVKETLGTDASGKRVTEWDYFLSGENKGKIREKRDWRGNRFVYDYDAKGRLTKETNAAVGHETVYSYAPVDASDILGEHAGVAAVVSDDRPRCEVRYEKDPETEAMVEVARTYFVYSPTQEIVERAATAGAAYGAAGALRTVKTWYAPDDARPFYAGRLASVRNEDGSLRVYDYGLDDDRWIETVTQLHEQAPEPVSGKTTRSSVVYDRVGNVVERNREVFIDGAWHLIDRTVYEYDIEGHVIKETDFAGRVTTTVWGGNCCGKTSMTLPNGTRFTYAYDDEGRLIAETKLDPIPCTTHFEYDALGRVVKTWKDGLNPETTVYDIFGQVISQTDVRGGVTRTAYSLDGNTVTTTLPNGATQIRKTDAIGRLLEVSGTAVQPQVVTYGPLWERIATGARWQQTEQNLLGQTVRQTRSGANGSTLETTTTYDTYGRVAQITAVGQPTQTFAYAATGEQTALTQSVDEVWRKQTTETDYCLRDGEVWQRQVATLSCSDTSIAPLAQTAYAQVSGLSVTNTFNQITVDVRGNETRTFGNETQRTILLPFCTNPQIERYAFGQLVETVDTACVTNRFEVDALDRRVAAIDGRNNRTAYAYDAKNNLVSTTDAVGAVTAYGYDVMGQTVAVTNALGNVTVYEYDLRGNKTYEGGATYPVRYTYDVFGNKTSMTTYRNEASGVGDTTTWTYDESSGVLLSERWANGRTKTYDYTDEGRLRARRNMRGNVVTYRYTQAGLLSDVIYDDETPNVAYTYDALGRVTNVVDVLGKTVYFYDRFGERRSRTMYGRIRHLMEWNTDTFGRNAGYVLLGMTACDYTYHKASGRLNNSNDVPVLGFQWKYLQGTHLKESLDYPYEKYRVEWQYEQHRDLVSHIKNGELSSYHYEYDLLRRCTSKEERYIDFQPTNAKDIATRLQLEYPFEPNERAVRKVTYRYTPRNEVRSVNQALYAYDDAGNRTLADHWCYDYNELNQVVKITSPTGEVFIPRYDLDGNQTSIDTETGVWEVSYDAENRPVFWRRGEDTVHCLYDHLGRLVERTTRIAGEQITHQYIYNGFQCVVQWKVGAETFPSEEVNYFWDPTDNPMSTLLERYTYASGKEFYFHDNIKNVTDYIGRNSWSHYTYNVFGSDSERTLLLEEDLHAPIVNVFRFSSERKDEVLGLIRYPLRFLNPRDAHWTTREPLARHRYTTGHYRFVKNAPPNQIDFWGMTAFEPFKFIDAGEKVSLSPSAFPNLDVAALALSYYAYLDAPSEKTVLSETVLSLNSAIKHNCCTSKGQAGFYYTIRPYGAIGIIAYTPYAWEHKLDKALGGQLYSTQQHERKHLEYAAQEFNDSTAILQNVMQPCEIATCDDIRREKVLNYLRAYHLRRVYNNLKLHLDDYPPGAKPSEEYVQQAFMNYQKAFDKTNVVSGWCTQKDQRNSYAHPEACK